MTIEPFAQIERWKAEAERSNSDRLRRDIEEMSDNIADMLSHLRDGSDALWQLSLPVGWVPLAARLHKELIRHAPDYMIAQIKEKFGGLRYYIDFSDNRPEGAIGKIYALIDDAEKRSHVVCDVCGGPGTTTTEGYRVTTRCEPHRTYRDTEEG